MTKTKNLNAQVRSAINNALQGIKKGAQNAQQSKRNRNRARGENRGGAYHLYLFALATLFSVAETGGFTSGPVAGSSNAELKGRIMSSLLSFGSDDPEIPDGEMSILAPIFKQVNVNTELRKYFFNVDGSSMRPDGGKAGNAYVDNRRAVTKVIDAVVDGSGSAAGYITGKLSKSMKLSNKTANRLSAFAEGVVEAPWEFMKRGLNIRRG